MTEAVQAWLPTPSTADSNQTFAQWCWSTQVFQSMNMVSEIAWYRRGAGKGENNLGSLVWQLNDIWQGTSWSSIEYSGRWKVLHYGMTGIYTPLVVYPFWTPENATLEVLATSDRWETVSGRAQLTWYDWAGKELETSFKSFKVPTLNNSVVFQATGLANILPKGKNVEDVFMLMNVSAKIEGKTVTNEAVVRIFLLWIRLFRSYLSAVHSDLVGERHPRGPENSRRTHQGLYVHSISEGRRRRMDLAGPSGRHSRLLRGQEDQRTFERILPYPWN